MIYLTVLLLFKLEYSKILFVLHLLPNKHTQQLAVKTQTN